MRGDWVEAIPIIHTGSNPVLTTMNRAVELITQRNADNGDERPIYSFIVRWRKGSVLVSNPIFGTKRQKLQVRILS